MHPGWNEPNSLVRQRQDQFEVVLDKLVDMYGRYSCVEKYGMRALHVVLGEAAYSPLVGLGPCERYYLASLGASLDTGHMIKLLKAIMEAEPKSVLSRRSRKRDGSMPLKVAWERDFSIGVLFVLLRAHPSALHLLVSTS